LWNTFNFSAVVIDCDSHKSEDIPSAWNGLALVGNGKESWQGREESCQAALRTWLMLAATYLAVWLWQWSGGWLRFQR
jgi:hypothetical protein